MMRHFYIWLLFFFTTIARERDDIKSVMLRFRENIQELNMNFDGLDICQKIVPEFTFYEIILIALVFMLALLMKGKQRMNKRLLQDIRAIKHKISEDDAVVTRLSTYLERGRSRNSGIESPLRRMKRDVEILIKKTENDCLIFNKLVNEFQDFKQNFIADAVVISGLPTDMDMDKLRIKAELAMLKRFVIGELDALRNVGKYFKALVDEAEDDVDRVLMSEGL